MIVSAAGLRKIQHKIKRLNFFCVTMSTVDALSKSII